MQINNYNYTIYFYLNFLFLLFLFSCLNSYYFFDMISFFLSLMTLVLGIMVFYTLNCFSNFYLNSNNKFFLFFLLIMILFFCFLYKNFFFFFLFFEFSVIPIFLYIMLWGDSFEKIRAGFYLFFYTYFSSLSFIFILFYFWNLIFSFDLEFMFLIKSFFLNFMSNFSVFLIMLVFLVKMPVFLLHFWLPLAHVESPLMGSMILAGLMLKLGTYGLIRLMDFCSLIFKNYSSYFISLGIFGSSFSIFLALLNFDLKKIVAYCSISHMTFMLICFQSSSDLGKLGSLLLMLGHAFSSAGMFYCCGMVYYRSYSRSIMEINSLSYVNPLISMWWLLICCMNLALPPFLNFFSEYFIYSIMVYSLGLMVILSFFIFFLNSLINIFIMVILVNGLLQNFSMDSNLSLMENLLSFFQISFMFIFLFSMMFFDFFF